MGQNQSSEKTSSSRGESRADANRLGLDREQHRDRKVHRRISIQALSGKDLQGAASTSASHVAAQGTTSHHLDTANLERMLQSTSPELASKQARPERSRSRKSGEKEVEPSTAQSVPVSVPPTSGGIDVPANTVATTLPTRSRQEELEDQGKASEELRTFVPMSHHRPPRLPLPIAEVPESPSLLPVNKTDSDIPIFDTDVPDLPKRNSMLSVTTQDEEDVGEELQPFGVGYTGQTVPYTIEWNQPAERVFVTGTFAAWDKKYRLKKSDSHPGRFKTVINLPPGTHHLKFFVDNQMVTSPDLPTAVDFNNILVNYIEISTDDIPKRDARRESTQIPSKQIPYQASPRPEATDSIEREQYSGTVTPGEGEEYSSGTSEIPPEEMPEGDFRQLFPQALVDIDLHEEDSRHKNAAQIITDNGMPPSLPLFLSRSILNAGPNVGVKDDSSVLALPNHTVLNHLMTSNVRNGVLATSVTTRYKKKYVTTISFKPVPKTSPFP